MPADKSTFARCSGPNGLDNAVRGQILNWVGEGGVAAWIRHPHAPKPGFRPLEVFRPGGASASAAAARKTVRIGDNFFVKDRLTVRSGTTVVWEWPAAGESGDVHDVALRSGPRGVRKFHSEAASTDFTFRRRLRKPGRYRIRCTLHEEMRMTIRVRPRG